MSVYEHSNAKYGICVLVFINVFIFQYNSGHAYAHNLAVEQ